MLKVEHIQTWYGNIQALKNVSLTIKEGEIVTLIGANGAGKSTTLMSLSGIYPPKEGKITFCGQDITHLNAEETMRLGIVQVPEGRRIFPQMSVLENLEIGAYLRTEKSDKESIKSDINEAFLRFPILGKRKSQLGGTLSGGEQQMLAISRALLARPKLLLLDEPSLGLAPLIIKQIFEIIKKINKENNTTVFLVEQNANQALKIADRGYVMENGVIILEDVAANLLSDEAVKKAYLGI